MRLMTNRANDKQPDQPPTVARAESLRQLREDLAALEHEQWCEWSQTVADTEALSPERTARWAKRWVSYSALSEADKDLDRAYADRVIGALAQLGLVTLPSDAGRER